MRSVISTALPLLLAAGSADAATFILEGSGNVSGGIQLADYGGSYVVADFTFMGNQPEYVHMIIDGILAQCPTFKGQCTRDFEDVDFVINGQVRAIENGVSYKFVLRDSDPYFVGGPHGFKRSVYSQFLRFSASDSDDFSYRLVVSTAPGPVPEPATWAMMIVGFGLVGSTLRGAARGRGSMSSSAERLTR